MRRKVVVSILLFASMFFISSLSIIRSANVTTNLEAWEVVNCWDGTKEWVDDGAKITLPGGVDDAWNRRADVLNNDDYGPLFNIENNVAVSMTFSIGLFDNSGTVISQPNNSSAIDIFVLNKADDSELMMLRIWTDAGGWNNGAHSYQIYPIPGDWGTVINGVTWINGDATLDSEFFIQFSKDNLFESYVAGTAEISRLDNADALLAYADRLDNVDQIYFRIAGDNGFTVNTEVIISDINGQSLQSSSSQYDDTVAPIIFESTVSSTITRNISYEIPVTSYDLLSNAITYRIEDLSGNVLSSTNSFTPDTFGALSVKLFAIDDAGNEAEKTYVFDVESETSVSSNLEAWQVVNCWDGTKEWVDEGAKITLPGGVADAWNRRADILNNDDYGPLFNISNNDTVSMTFSIGLYDNAGNIVSKSNNSNALDIYVINKANDQEIMLLRIWTDSGSYNNGNHSYAIFPIFGDWGTVIYGENWISGDAMLDSEFFLQFSKTSLFESYIGGSADITRLDNADALLAYTYRFDDIDQIYFRIAGDNGFTANTEVIISDISGQSLARVLDEFDDTVSPLVYDSNVSTTITQDESYEIPITSYDLISNTISYRIEDISGNVLSNTNSFTPDTAGEITVKLFAIDDTGNETSNTYVFDVVSNITAPVITIPTISDMTKDYFDTLEFDVPVVTEDTGVYTLVLKIYDPSDLVDPLYILEDVTNDMFLMSVFGTFASGDYVLIYEAENSAGLTVSDSQTVNISVNIPYVDTIASVDDSIGLADYITDGIRLRTTEFTAFTLGTYNMDYGFNVIFNVPTTSPVVNNSLNGYVEIIVYDPSDPETHIMFRVWIGVAGPDNPTNVYIKYPGENYVDLPDAGWISKTVNDVDMQFHLGFNTEDYFIGERTSGMVNAEVGQTEIEAFLTAVGTSELSVAIRTASLGDSDYFELLIVEVNGQSLTSTDGIIDSVNDAVIEVVGNVTELALLDEEIEIPVYTIDLFTEIVIFKAVVTDPNGLETEYPGLTDVFAFTPSIGGEYTVKFVVTGSNDVDVETDAYTINVKDKITLPTITFTNTYESTYTQGTTITIIDPTYSSDVESSSKTISIVKPNGDVVTVSAGDSFTFDVSGIYTITYSAADDALPTVNSVNEVISVNIPDTSNPTIVVEEMPTTGIVDEEILLPDFTVEDDNTYDITISIIDPNDVKNTLSTDATGNAFTPDMVGEWTVEVRVVDLYDNVTVEEYTITIEEQSSSNVSLYIIIGSVVVAAGAGGFFLLKRFL